MDRLRELWPLTSSNNSSINLNSSTSLVFRRRIGSSNERSYLSINLRISDDNRTILNRIELSLQISVMLRKTYRKCVIYMPKPELQLRKRSHCSQTLLLSLLDNLHNPYISRNNCPRFQSLTTLRRHL